MWNLNKCCVISVLFCATLTSFVTNAQISGTTTLISLSTYNATNQNAQKFSVFANINTTETLTVNIVNIDPLVHYFIIQAHSFQNEVVLSNNSLFPFSTFVNGTNVGLVQKTKTVSSSYNFYVRNQKPYPTNNVLLVVVAYRAKVPVPGGCSVEISPYQQLQYTESIITVNSQPASLQGISCEFAVLKHDMYRIYLPEHDFSSKTYFETLQKMILVEDIESYGTKILKRVGSNLLQTIYNVYRGTGSVYAVIASLENRTAAYVPITTYACDSLDSADICSLPIDALTGTLCFAVFIMGLFICFYGHEFFSTELFLLGSLSGGFFSYIGLLSTNLGSRDVMIISLVLAVVFGIIWLMIWRRYGLPVLFVILVLLILGFLIASIIFFTQIGDMLLYQNDINFWVVFFIITMLPLYVLKRVMPLANILACSILGAYMVIVPLDYCIGANFKYIFINTIRRMTVDKFQYAVLGAPYGFRDTILAIVWLCLAAIGLVFQFIRLLSDDRPAFPPSPERLLPRLPTFTIDERTPLLSRLLTRTTHNEANNPEGLVN